MRRLTAVLLATGIMGATLAVPREAAAGCTCGCSSCEYSGLNTTKCTYEGNCLCTLGPGGGICPKPIQFAATFDGTISEETRVADVQAKDVILTHRSCDGGVVERHYSARMAEHLRSQTREITI